ncbi:PD40 domain-containing protein [Candidatus Gottesmanbacteria bacterium]|nr:PD40 domain-containing protein [Candidatus Gottesmanbacteria bacterium]
MPEKLTQYLKRLKAFVRNHQKLSIALTGLFLLLLIILSKSTNTSNNLTNQNNNLPTTNTTSPNTSQTPPDQNTIYFAKNIIKNLDIPPTVELYTADAQGNNIKQVGKIHAQAKNIKPLAINTYLYIGDLGFLDRGAAIYRFDSTNNAATKIYTASSGYQIESYLPTPNHQSLIIWEETQGNASLGQSRIIYQDLTTPTNKKILLEEPLSDQTKYPLFYSDATKKIYLDSYSVNRKGKNRGLFTLSLLGALNSVLPVNDYSTQPILSKDGRRIAYTSYNPDTRVKLPAPPVPNEIFRESVRNPNQIKVLDLTTGQTSLLAENLNGLIFDNLLFLPDGNSLIYRTLQIEANRTTTPLSYQLLDISTKKSTLYSRNTNGLFVTAWSGGSSLFAVRSDLIDNLGSAAGGNSPILKSTYLFDPATQIFTKILVDDNIQLIAVQ